MPIRSIGRHQQSRCCAQFALLYAHPGVSWGWAARFLLPCFTALLFELTHLHVSPYVYLRRFSDAPPVACDFASAHRVRAARAFVFAAGAAYPAGKRACKYAANSSLTSDDATRIRPLPLNSRVCCRSRNACLDSDRRAPVRRSSEIGSHRSIATRRPRLGAGYAGDQKCAASEYSARPRLNSTALLPARVFQ